MNQPSSLVSVGMKLCNSFFFFLQSLSELMESLSLNPTHPCCFTKDLHGCSTEQYERSQILLRWHFWNSCMLIVSQPGGCFIVQSSRSTEYVTNTCVHSKGKCFLGVKYLNNLKISGPSTAVGLVLLITLLWGILFDSVRRTAHCKPGSRFTNSLV